MPDLKYSNETAFLLEQFFVQSISLCYSGVRFCNLIRIRKQGAKYYLYDRYKGYKFTRIGYKSQAKWIPQVQQIPLIHFKI